MSPSRHKVEGPTDAVELTLVWEGGAHGRARDTLKRLRTFISSSQTRIDKPSRVTKRSNPSSH
jgi:hypothetical protein